MKYAYQVDADFGIYPLFGSLIRALGKGWKVAVAVQTDHAELFYSLLKLLVNPAQLEIISPSNITKTLSKNFDLILSEIPFEAEEFTGHSMVIDAHPNRETYDLISQFAIHKMRNQGVVAITGNGKGKTTTALGIAGEAFTNGKKVAVIQWFKERKQGDLTWAINEHNFPELLKKPERVEFYPTGLGFFGSPNMDRVKGDEAYQQHKQKAYEGLELARKMITSRQYEVVVLDELIDTVKEIAQNIIFPLIEYKDLEQFFLWAVEQPVQIIVTGRRVTQDWQEFIKTSIEITEVKHPWSTSKQGAISGLDY